MTLEGFTPYRKEDAEKYNKLRWWAGLTFGDLVDKAADIYPDKVGFVDGMSRLTFSEAREKVNRLAVSFMELGIKTLDRILVQLPNWNEFIYAYFALQKIGAIPVLLIDKYRQYEINYLIRLTGATHWVVAEKYKKVDYRPIVKDVLKESPRIQHVILARSENPEGFLSLEQLIGNGDLTEANLTRLAERRPDPMQVGHLGPTGGTTGLPKVVPRTHNDYLCRVEYAARAWELTSNDTLLVAAPIGHDLPSSIGLCSILFAFGKTVMLDSLEAEDMCRVIEREKVTAIPLVPALASRLARFEAFEQYDLSSLKKMYVGGGAAVREVVKAVDEKMGCIYLNAYGGTEGMNAHTRMNDDFESVLRTVGKPTCPYDTYKVVDDDGRELPPNTSGQLLVKGPGVFTGYYNDPDENKDAFDADGFFKTGDMAMIDDKGIITLTGRLREIIKRGGESISTVEIERLVITHPDVEAVAVVGMPDPELGERACAYIQPKPGATLTFEDVISHLKGLNASVLQLPERVEFIDAMPLTKANKLDKRALEEDIKKKII
ncbi:MAG: AMP-binding protein [Deltaproteobacteria bacterium]|nr:AMP-binding protein [Deltaproteobacteria bacterium]